MSEYVKCPACDQTDGAVACFMCDTEGKVSPEAASAFMLLMGGQWDAHPQTPVARLYEINPRFIHPNWRPHVSLLVEDA